MTIPIIALDVDGVLSPLVDPNVALATNLGGWAADEWVKGSHRVYQMVMATPVLQFLRGVTEAGTARVEWHTTWREDAQTSLASEYGLPAWPLMDRVNAYRNSSEWWKYDVVRAAVENGERVIWIDDDISDAVDNEEISVDFLMNPNVHMVSPDLRVGISRDELSEIKAKLQEWTS